MPVLPPEFCILCKIQCIRRITKIKEARKQGPRQPAATESMSIMRKTRCKSSIVCKNTEILWNKTVFIFIFRHFLQNWYHYHWFQVSTKSRINMYLLYFIFIFFWNVWNFVLQKSPDKQHDKFKMFGPSGWYWLRVHVCWAGIFKLLLAFGWKMLPLYYCA